MKSLIIYLILLGYLLYELGGFQIQLSPFRVKFESPYQFFGVICIITGMALFRKQDYVDSKKEVIEFLEEYVEKKEIINPV